MRKRKKGAEEERKNRGGKLKVSNFFINSVSTNYNVNLRLKSKTSKQSTIRLRALSLKQNNIKSNNKTQIKVHIN